MRFTLTLTMAAAIACFSAAEIHAGDHSSHNAHGSRGHSSHQAHGARSHSSHQTHGARVKSAKASRAAVHTNLQELSKQHQNYVRSFEDVRVTHQSLLDSHTKIAEAAADLDSMSVDDLMEIEAQYSDLAVKMSSAQNVISAQKEMVKLTIEALRKP